MILSMAVTLYTSRVVLDVLGVSDFGIYNVIGGVVVLISIINNSMSAATQRFITFELGKGDLQRVSNTFSMSMSIHFLICILVFLLGETLGVYYVDNHLNVPADRMNAAFWLFQISLVTLFFNIIRIPYHASIIAYEKMDFFAIISIIEVLLQLVIVFLLTILDIDKLILYGLLILVVTAVSTCAYSIYCKKVFSTCRYYWFYDKSYFKELTSFLGWNFVGAIGTTGTNQIGNMLVNYYCGPVINATYGVANRVNMAIAGFTNSFQVAYTPQITKLYSQGKTEELFRLMNRSALLSFYLLFVIAAPLCFYLDYILGIWLVEVPPYASTFIIFLITYNLIDSVQAPFWKVITATGNIKYYEIWLNLLLMLNIPLTYYFLKNDFPPYIVVIVSTFINFISAVVRTVHVKIQVGVSIREYVKDVILKVVTISALYILPVLLFREQVVQASFGLFMLFYVASAIYILTMAVAIGISKDDRRVIMKLVKSKILKNK